MSSARMIDFNQISLPSCLAASQLTTDSIWYELRNAVYSRQFSHAESLLIAMPGLFELCNSIGETVLHFLAVENDLEGVKWLYAHGLSLNTKNRFGQPMVFEVASAGHKEMVLWLAEHGAEFSVADRSARDILTYLRRGRDEERKRHGEEMAQFLLKNIPSLRKNEPRQS